MSLQGDWPRLAIRIQVGYPRGQFEVESVVDSWKMRLACGGKCYSDHFPSLTSMPGDPLLQCNLFLDHMN